MLHCTSVVDWHKTPVADVCSHVGDWVENGPTASTGGCCVGYYYAYVPYLALISSRDRIELTRPEAIHSFRLRTT